MNIIVVNTCAVAHDNNRCQYEFSIRAYTRSMKFACLCVCVFGAKPQCDSNNNRNITVRVIQYLFSEKNPLNRAYAGDLRYKRLLKRDLCAIRYWLLLFKSTWHTSNVEMTNWTLQLIAFIDRLCWICLLTIICHR